MGLSTRAIIGISLAALAAVVIGKKILSGNSEPIQPVEKDESINNEHNISYGGRSRRNRKRNNKSRRR